MPDRLALIQATRGIIAGGTAHRVGVMRRAVARAQTFAELLEQASGTVAAAPVHDLSRCSSLVATDCSVSDRTEHVGKLSHEAAQSGQGRDHV